MTKLLFKSDSSQNYAAVCIAMHVWTGVDWWAFYSLFSPAVTYYVHTAAAVHSSPTYQLAWLWGAQWRVIAHSSSAFIQGDKKVIKTRQIAIAVSGMTVGSKPGRHMHMHVQWRVSALLFCIQGEDKNSSNCNCSKWHFKTFSLILLNEQYKNLSNCRGMSLSVLSEWKKNLSNTSSDMYRIIFFIQRANSLVWLNWLKKEAWA